MDLGLVCDGCGAFSELGIGSCVDCSAGLSLDSIDAPNPELLEPVEGTKEYGGHLKDYVDDEDTDSRSTTPPISCSSCGADIAGGNRFCGICGTPIEAAEPPPAAPRAPAKSGGAGKKTLFFSSIQAAKAKLVLIKGEGHDGESYSLAGEDHRVGRSDADIIFEEDEFLSPVHANFFYVNGGLVVRDEGSTNGVYLRIHDSCPLEHENHFLVGEQVMQVRLLNGEAGLTVTEDGTYLYASPRRPTKFELIQVMQGGAQGILHPAQNDSATLGREENDMNFPDDPFISGHHAQVTCQGDALTLTDMGSKNGTFVRITKDTPLSHGDYVFMGQQLLRVEIV
ncbi:MAG: FHA domain-containing protein [Myxococcales bacterium]|nr:FHA domain-containing protein [Myxococcales bacterium]